MAHRILIVEDSTLVTDAFDVLFRAAGYEVEIAATVGEAVERLSAERVDIMLLDLSLPDGDGLEVLERVDAQQRRVGATIAMTGRDDAQTRQRCLDAGCVDVLVKPLPIGDLLRHIERHLA